MTSSLPCVQDIAVRALQLSSNQSVNAALRLLVYLMEEKLGGIKNAGKFCSLIAETFMFVIVLELI